jgi:nucleotide-binding universal stress UspA family protein
MQKRILITLGESNSCQSALDIACNLAALAKAKLIGLNVTDELRFYHASSTQLAAASTGMVPITPVLLAEPELEEMQKQTSDEAKQRASNFHSKAEVIGIANEIRSEVGNPKEILVNHAKTVDLVISGSTCFSCNKQNGTDLGQYFLKHSARPILLIPGEIIGRSRLLIAYDGSLSAERVLRPAIDLATLTQMDEVHLLYIGEQSQAEFLLPPVQTYLESHLPTVKSICRQGSTAAEIGKYTKEIDASFLAVGSFGKSAIRETLFGSTTRELLESNEVAILAIN